MNHLQITGVANAREENNTAAPISLEREKEGRKVYIESVAGSRKHTNVRQKNPTK